MRRGGGAASPSRAWRARPHASKLVAAPVAGTRSRAGPSPAAPLVRGGVPTSRPPRLAVATAACESARMTATRADLDEPGASTRPTFRLRSGESWRDPFPSYAALREHDPVHHVADGDFWVLTRFDDVWAAAGDPATFSSSRGLTVAYDELAVTGLEAAMPLVFLDPPAHTAFRRLVAKGLTPRKVAAIEPAVRAFVVERLESARAQGEVDVVAHLCKPLPSFVVAHYLGVPADDRALFDRWTEAIVQAAAAGKAGAAGNAFGDLLGYFAALVERRRSEPADDVVSDLVALGEDTVSVARVLGFAFTMVAGGNDTATGMLAGAMALLTERPDQRARLLAEPALVPKAVEEILRVTSPVQNLARTTLRDVVVRGTTIPAGRKVLLCYAAANRDPREFGPRAEDFDVGRDIAKLLTFGYGTHYCVGAAAARLQGRVVLEELLRRCPGFQVDVAAGRWAEGNYVRRHDALPWTAA
jgi:cytochrome P450